MTSRLPAVVATIGDMRSGFVTTTPGIPGDGSR
jgi:hypothetical protein